MKWHSEALKKYSLALYFNRGLSMVLIATCRKKTTTQILKSLKATSDSTISSFSFTVQITFSFVHKCVLGLCPRGPGSYLLVDFDSFLVLLQLSAVVSNLQETFVGRAETQKKKRDTVRLWPLFPERSKRNICTAEWMVCSCAPADKTTTTNCSINLSVTFQIDLNHNDFGKNLFWTGVSKKYQFTEC